jgi:hypothetical protein
MEEDGIMGVKRRNFIDLGLTPYMKAIPLGPGETFHMVANKTTDTYFQLLKNRHVDDEHIVATLSAAYDLCTTNQGDNVLVYPGDHVMTSMVTWDKDQCLIYGMGGPNMSHQPSTLTTGGVRLTCKTTAISYCLTVTGDYVRMYNIGTVNTAAATTNLGDILISVGRNFYAESCAFRGGNADEQVQSATSGCPVSITGGYAHYFKNCFIGSAGNATRTTGPGFVKFFATAGGAGMCVFDGCVFAMRSETDGDNAKGILIQDAAIDRLLIFKGCTFYNFSVNWGAQPDHMICDQQTSTHNILFHGGNGCVGFDAIGDSARLMSADPLPHTNGVEALAMAVT